MVKNSKQKVGKKLSPEALQVKNEGAWLEIMMNNKSKAVQYERSQEHKMGQKITHLTFGDGIVNRMEGDHKIRVTFKGGDRLLIHRVV